MEENVALDSSKQKQFVKSIKGIQKLLKGNSTSKSINGDKNNVKIGKIRKPRRKERGLVYLSHIPHGFYEHQMTEYFKQFGVVTNARVIRSKRTGKSKGHAFVEFRDTHVANIVAETMNNYLMGKRLIKASIIPPEKQRKFAKRKHWNEQNNPSNDFRQKVKKAHNALKDENQELKIARRLVSNLNRTKKKLQKLGIDYDFFSPVDIPEALLNQLEVKKEVDVETSGDIKIESNTKNKVKEEKPVQKDDKKNKGKNPSVVNLVVQDPIQPKQPDNSSQKKSNKTKKLQQSNENLVKPLTKGNKKDNKIPNNEKNVVQLNKNVKNTKVALDSNISRKQQQKKLKNAEVKPPEDFIKVLKDSDVESDSSVEFDSDEYDKEMEQDDSDVPSDDETDEELDEDITSNEDESVENEPLPPKKRNIPSTLKIQTTQNKQQGKKVKSDKPLAQQPKKKIPQIEVPPSKKPKFEKKGNKKTLNKVIKKKK